MKKIVYTILCLGLLILSHSAWAEFGLSVTPVEEAESIRFGRVAAGEKVTKEVEVKITSDVVDQYEIRQRLLDPLTDDRGIQLNPEAVIFYTITNSNSHGSLYQDSPYTLSALESVLYTSSSQGTGDSFIVAYCIDGNNVNAVGKFLGRIYYSLIPLSNSGTEQDVILNVYVDTERKFEIAVTTSSPSSNKLKLRQEDKKGSLTGHIEIEIKGRLGEKYDIYQVVEEDFKNEEGKTISLEKIKFAVTGEKGNSQYTSYVSLPREQRPIYSSHSAGEGDNVIVSFSISKEDLEGLNSGYFNAKLAYTVESLQEGIIETIPIAVELEIKPIFDIEVSAGFEGLSFRNLKPNQSVKKELVIKVKSNMGKPYSVVQKLSIPLTNQEGDVIPAEALSLYQTIVKGLPGEILFPEFTPVKLGDTEIFTSDSEGSSSEFKVNYRLEVPRDMKGGDYFSNLSYSLLAK